MTNELWSVLAGVGIALVVGLPIMVGIPWVRYRLWLRKFRKENRIAKEKFDAECRAEDAAWEAETREWLKGWQYRIDNNL